MEGRCGGPEACPGSADPPSEPGMPFDGDGDEAAAVFVVEAGCLERQFLGGQGSIGGRVREKKGVAWDEGGVPKRDRVLRTLGQSGVPGAAGRVVPDLDVESPFGLSPEASGFRAMG